MRLSCAAVTLSGGMDTLGCLRAGSVVPLVPSRAAARHGMDLPDMAIELLTSPHLIDLVLALTALEAAAIVVTGGLTAAAAARLLVPGVCLMLALRAALAGAAWPFVPAALLAALVAHLIDLRGRWKR